MQVYFYAWPTESTEGAGETEVVPSLAEELGKLWSLVEKGALTAAEFKRAKAKLLKSDDASAERWDGTIPRAEVGLTMLDLAYSSSAIVLQFTFH